MSKENEMYSELIEGLKENMPPQALNHEPLKKHIERFVKDVCSDSECEGMNVQLSTTQPYGSKGYVLSINIANTANDSQAAVEALAKQPDFA